MDSKNKEEVVEPNNNKEEENNNDTNQTDQEEQITLTQEELKEYLSYVPFGDEENAYNNKYTNINTINKRYLLSNALGVTFQNAKDYYTELQTDNEEINTDFTYDDTNQKYYYFMEKEKLNPILSKMYDMDIDDFNLVNNYENDIAVWNGICFQYFDNGFSYRYCAGSIDKISIIENYEANDNELIIEEYAVGLDVGNNLTDFYTQKEVEDLAYTQIPKGEEINRAEEYLEEHKDEFTLYKHTFKKNDTGYYWYSTEIA